VHVRFAVINDDDDDDDDDLMKFTAEELYR